jgi:hypothetical protein
MAAETTPQHLVAMEKANRVRLARAELKRRVNRGEVTVAEVLRDVPDFAENMTLYDLLAAQRRWAKTRTLKLLARLPADELKTLGAMTERQRRYVGELLER